MKPWRRRVSQEAVLEPVESRPAFTPQPLKAFAFSADHFPQVFFEPWSYPTEDEDPRSQGIFTRIATNFDLTLLAWRQSSTHQPLALMPLCPTCHDPAYATVGASGDGFSCVDHGYFLARSRYEALVKAPLMDREDAVSLWEAEGFDLFSATLIEEEMRFKFTAFAMLFRLPLFNLHEAYLPATPARIFELCLVAGDLAAADAAMASLLAHEDAVVASVGTKFSHAGSYNPKYHSLLKEWANFRAGNPPLHPSNLWLHND